MSTYEARARIGPDRKLELLVPPGFADSDVDVVVQTRNGTGAALTREKRSEALRRVAGSIDDPTFERPPQGEFESREFLD